MDLFEFDHIKAEKKTAMNRYRGVQKMAKLFRLFELFLALVFLSWLSTRLPSVFQISGKYLKELCVILVSPRFVFLLGNAIVLTLFAKSGHIYRENNTGSNLYEEFLKNSSSHKIRTEASPTDKEVVFQDKQTVTEEKCRVPMPTREKHQHVATQKKICRTQSENVKRMVSEKKTLRRSVTSEKCRRDEKADQEADAARERRNGEDHEEEDVSNEEFQRRIEEFIAKQVRFHKEESMAIVLQNNNNNNLS